MEEKNIVPEIDDSYIKFTTLLEEINKCIESGSESLFKDLHILLWDLQEIALQIQTSSIKPSLFKKVVQLHAGIQQLFAKIQKSLLGTNSFQNPDQSIMVKKAGNIMLVLADLVTILTTLDRALPKTSTEDLQPTRKLIQEQLQQLEVSKQIHTKRFQDFLSLKQQQEMIMMAYSSPLPNNKKENKKTSKPKR